MSDWSALEQIGPGSSITKVFTCSQCKQTTNRPINYVIYKSDFDEAEFCSYNCRCKYYKEHEKERNLALEKRHEKLFEPKPKISKYRQKQDNLNKENKDR